MKKVTNFIMRFTDVYAQSLGYYLRLRGTTEVNLKNVWTNLCCFREIFVIRQPGETVGYLTDFPQ